MKDLILINQSEFSEEFESIELNSTFLLSKTKAKLIWEKYIDMEFKPYHLLDELHWLNSTSSKNIGNWIESYNNDDYRKIRNVLNSAIPWEASDKLFFCMSRYFIVQTTWSDFKTGWINFLMCEDENPVLINGNDLDSVIIFTPMGQIKKIPMLNKSNSGKC